MRNLINIGFSPEDVFRMGSASTAMFFGQDDLGVIAPGARACLAAWNEAYECEFSVADGMLLRG